MKDCIVLSGHFRTFEKTKENIKKFIEINELDVYCHLWVTDPKEIEIIQEELRPVEFIHNSTEDYEWSFKEMQNRIFENNPKPGTIDVPATQASNHFSRRQAYRLIDREYDNLVYCRYDLGFQQLFTYENLSSVITPLEQSYNIISDIFAMMPFEFAPYYFLFDNFELLHSLPFQQQFLNYLREDHKYPEHDILTHINQRYCPHMLLLRNLVLNDIKFDKVNLPVFLQR
jgi:hypothetical protein